MYIESDLAHHKHKIRSNRIVISKRSAVPIDKAQLYLEKFACAHLMSALDFSCVDLKKKRCEDLFMNPSSDFAQYMEILVGEQDDISDVVRIFALFLIN